MFIAFLALLMEPAPLTAEALRQLPKVKVEVSGAKRDASQTLVHLCDWHYVPFDRFTADIQQALGRKLSREELEREFEQHLKDVETVQKEQKEVLRHLARKHGAQTIFVEGLTDTSVLLFQARVAAYRELKEKIEAKGVPRKVRELLLELGAVGQLMIEGEDLRVEPLEDERLLEEANPVQPDGTVRFDERKVSAREGEMARRLKGQATAVVVCGLSHDLGAAIRRAGFDGVRYIRVTSASVPVGVNRASGRAKGP